MGRPRGGSGLCDLTITGKTHICELRDGAIKMHTVNPGIGLPASSLDNPDRRVAI
ncbi:MAG: hypothetical protein R3E58_10315 [Phycisphaerae bacterium]